MHSRPVAYEDITGVGASAHGRYGTGEDGLKGWCNICAKVRPRIFKNSGGALHTTQELDGC